MPKPIKRLFRHLIRGAAAAFGAEVHRMPPGPRVVRGAHNRRLVSGATYAPWLGEPSFMALFGRIKANTLVDVMRCYELWMLVRQLGPVPGSLIEVGVWRGGTGTLIASCAATLPGSPIVYLCDTFAGVVKASEKDSVYCGGEHADTSQALVERLLADVGVQNCQILRGVFPDDHRASLDREVFRFCHIDVDVYQSAADVFAFVWPRLSSGGIVVFDDFGFIQCDGVRRLVAELDGTPGLLMFQNLNGHAVAVKASAC